MEALETPTAPVTPPAGIILTPTHVTRAQAARILGRSKQTVYWQARQGGPLQPEDWWGTPMIPMHRVMAEADRPKGQRQ